MPSPLGHALTGFAVGWLTGPAGCRRVLPARPDVPGLRQRVWGWRWPLGFAAAGVAADLDLLAGLHSRYTHSIGATLLVAAGAWLALRGRHSAPAVVAVSLGLSYGSHVLLDYLASDSTPPFGVMALWPFSSEFYLSPVTVFLGISRRYWSATAWAQNAASVAWELALVVPLAGVAAWLRPPRTG